MVGKRRKGREGNGGEKSKPSAEKGKIGIRGVGGMDPGYTRICRWYVLLLLSPPYPCTFTLFYALTIFRPLTQEHARDPFNRRGRAGVLRMIGLRMQTWSNTGFQPRSSPSGRAPIWSDTKSSGEPKLPWPKLCEEKKGLSGPSASEPNEWSCSCTSGRVLVEVFRRQSLVLGWAAEAKHGAAVVSFPAALIPINCSGTSA